MVKTLDEQLRELLLILQGGSLDYNQCLRDKGRLEACLDSGKLSLQDEAEYIRRIHKLALRLNTLDGFIRHVKMLVQGSIYDSIHKAVGDYVDYAGPRRYALCTDKVKVTMTVTTERLANSGLIADRPQSTYFDQMVLVEETLLRKAFEDLLGDSSPNNGP